MTHYFIIPGLGNSGPEHWQTWFEKSGGNFHRIEQKEWDAPECKDWVDSIDMAIKKYNPEEVVLIGHSLGCSTIAKWAEQSGTKIKGALLVAPSDTDVQNYTFPAKGFSPISLNKINFKTIVVASTNDPWVSIERAAFFAEKWGSEFVNIGHAGHINAMSGHYQWQEGMDLLKRI
ncbi:alpha/beta hydrolase [Pollutibacter soli]|uniref:RBBP9/YdeN family alpha/beta hydrolase n=1 Tax=Pollutibacter soli TaxID=3034157 RepID=UPI003013CCCA